MQFRVMQRLIRTRFVWLGCCVFGLPIAAWAHNPFDNSIQATLSPDGLEVAITLGSDAAPRFLQAASPDQISKLGGMGAKTLPLDIAAKLVELESGSKTLPAESLQIMGDGLEHTFVLHYPKPEGNDLVFHARYHEIASEEMKLGTFVLGDEQGRQIGSGLITEANTRISLALPANTTVASLPTPDAAPGVAATAAPPEPVAASARQARISFGQFLTLGIEHILTGFDHLLFLGALLVACDRVKPMLAIITCFTLAHSVTLALAALGLVSISPRLVEPLIAASIIFVGIENFRGKVDLKERCLVTLGFGLIHGFGFASVLRESGLGNSGAALARPLLAFNLGVEIGQLAVASVFLPLLFLARRTPKFERHGTAAVSACVVALGGFWLIQRLLG